jgi:hypothetical protein
MTSGFGGAGVGVTGLRAVRTRPKPNFRKRTTFTAKGTTNLIDSRRLCTAFKSSYISVHKKLPKDSQNCGSARPLSGEPPILDQQLQ